MWTRRVVMALIGLGTAGAAHAATLTPQDGTTYVNAGRGFVAVTAPVETPPATRVMVSAASTALLTYSSQCAVRLPAGVWQVASAPPCEGNASLVDLTHRMHQGTDGSASGSDITAIVVGGIAAAVIGGTIILEQGDDNDRPASP